MPIEKSHIPPERKPVSEYPTPTPSVVIFTELVNRTDPAYQQNAPMMRGQLYSDIVGASMLVIAQYPTLYFLRERKFGTSDQLVLWDWATVPQAEDAYNAEVTYVSNAVPYPAFTRVYTIRRDVYDASTALAIGSTLTGIIGVRITQGGGGYTSAHGVIDGTDVDIQFVVSEGVIISGVILNEGTGVTSSDTIRIMGDGEGCVAVPIVQSTTCYLTSQKKQELGDDPLKNEFVRVIRVYETLPGPFIATTKLNDAGDTITVNTRRNIAANIVTQETLVGGVWTKVTKKGDDNFVAEENVETQPIPGNYVYSSRFRSDGSVIGIAKRLQKKTDITPGGNISGGLLSLTRIGEVSDLVSEEIVEVSFVPGPDVHGQHIDDVYGLVVNITKTIVKDNVFQSPNPAVDGTYYEVKPHDEWQSIQIASKLDLDSLPADVTWHGGQYHSFPPELITGIWNPVSNPYGAVIQWAEASCGCVDQFRAVLQTNFNKYSGVVKARYTEQFYFGVPPDDVTITQFFPESHTFGFAFASVCGCGSDNTARVTAIAPQFQIPLCIHDDFKLCVGATAACVGAPFSWTFAATNPAALPHGTYIMLPPHVERWRFGVFRRVLTEVLVP